MKNGTALIRELTGNFPVYPGHPLVIATSIMHAFPDYAAASERTEHGSASAAASSLIPGAGDHVGAAMGVLGIGAKGGTPEEMVAYAYEYWNSGQAGGHVKYVDEGNAQADAIKPHFLLAAQEWAATTACVS
jgi:hypothetical protein